MRFLRHLQTFRGPSWPFIISMSFIFKSEIWLKLLFLLFLRYLLLDILSRQEKSWLLLRFLRHSRTLRGPSWLLLFLSLEFCYICYFCAFCDICPGCFQLARKILVTSAIFSLRHLRTFRGPTSWPVLFLSLESCYICYSCDFCDICKWFSYIIFSQLFLLRQLRKKIVSKFLLTRSILGILPLFHCFDTPRRRQTRAAK